MIRARHALIVLAVAAGMLVAAVPAEASFPGANGRIAGNHFYDIDANTSTGDIFTMNPDGSGFAYVGAQYPQTEAAPAWSPDGTKIAFVTNRDGNNEIYVMNADGTGQTRLTNNPAGDGVPAWSPDGSKIAFLSTRDGGNGELYVMNADGTGQTRLTTDPAGEYQHDWSPDGAKIAFTSNRDGNFDIYSMNPDGTGITNLTSAPGDQVSPSWSPDGSKIAYSEASAIHVMNRDGSGQIQITHDSNAAFGSPTWSPNGAKLAIWLSKPNGPTFGIAVMNADGSGLVLIHDFLGSDFSENFGSTLDWGPVLSGYARPKGASPSQIFLVPAYAQCTAPNRTHGAPLSYGSCAPPTQTSGTLTVGTPDANGTAANSVAKILYTVHPGDLALTADITDIRNKSDLSDYTGEVGLVSDLRITDRNNTPSPDGPGPATVQDMSLATSILCTTTISTTIGSNCNITTSVKALFPGAITGGQRAIWQLGQVKLYDGGPDGDADTTGDNTLFMDQGIFIP